jgi:hypothetical protein
MRASGLWRSVNNTHHYSNADFCNGLLMPQHRGCETETLGVRLPDFISADNSNLDMAAEASDRVVGRRPHKQDDG